ncbi:hypothetical protein WMY93_022814 [Mugilogobius chulae]|uniref:Uncharacterized protein n=1 Tax=Mugilogobius chulae TaxID=88201 RepID=A0AAW0NCI2_9GOBI
MEAEAQEPQQSEEEQELQEAEPPPPTTVAIDQETSIQKETQQRSLFCADLFVPQTDSIMETRNGGKKREEKKEKGGSERQKWQRRKKIILGLATQQVVARGAISTKRSLTGTFLFLFKPVVPKVGFGDPWRAQKLCRGPPKLVHTTGRKENRV